MSRRGYGEGSISSYQTKNGVRWSIAYRAGGKQTRRGGYPTKAAAAKALRAALSETQQPGWQPPATGTLADYLDTWLVKKSLQIRPTTLTVYRMVATAWVGPALGQAKLSELTPAAFTQLWVDLTARGLAANTIRLARVVVKTALDDAVNDGLLAVNPVVRSGTVSAQKPDLNVWTLEQARSFLARTAEDDWGLMWRVLLLTGLRRGEALGLRWDDLRLDGDDPQLTVRRAVPEVRGGVPVFTEAKTSGSRRTIPLAPDTVALLRKHRARQAWEQRLLGVDCDLVFARPDGRLPPPDEVSKRFKLAQERLGMSPRLRLHDTRHTAATLWLFLGVPLHVVQRLLGHANPQTTLASYAHMLPGQGRDAVLGLASMLG